MISAAVLNLDGSVCVYNATNTNMDFDWEDSFSVV